MASAPKLIGDRAPVLDTDGGETLATKYRPTTFDEVIGNEDVVKSIQVGLQSKNPPRAYLFTGPSGCGKTTLARIIGKEHDIPSMNMIEIDAASFSKVEEIRRIVETVHMSGLGVSRRLYIIDECHALSRQAWQVLLKPIEESNRGVYWALCTTEVAKVPRTVVTRCQSYLIKPLDANLMEEFVEAINEFEDIGCTQEVIEVIAQNAKGSPRMGLQLLAMCRGVKSYEKAISICTNIDEEKDAIELIKLICHRQGFNWTSAIKLLKKLEAQEPEATRIVCLNYAARMLLGPQLKEGEDPDKKKSPTVNPARVAWLLRVIDVFSKPFYTSEKMAPLLKAVGELCFETETDA